jgi:uncharacterized protein (TIGR02246 family)
MTEAAAAEAELLALATAWAEAIVTNDAARIASYVTDGWVMVSESGVTSGRDFLARVAAGELTHSAMTTVGTTRVRIWSDTAVLTARIVNTAHYRGERFDADEWTTDVFVRRDGRWRCALSHYTARKDP